jgi:hypothetical protein
MTMQELRMLVEKQQELVRVVTLKTEYLTLLARQEEARFVYSLGDLA